MEFSKSADLWALNYVNTDVYKHICTLRFWS